MFKQVGSKLTQIVLVTSPAVVAQFPGWLDRNVYHLFKPCLFTYITAPFGGNLFLTCHIQSHIISKSKLHQRRIVSNQTLRTYNSDFYYYTHKSVFKNVEFDIIFGILFDFLLTHLFKILVTSERLQADARCGKLRTGGYGTHWEGLCTTFD